MVGVRGEHSPAILFQLQPRSNSCGAITAKLSTPAEFTYQVLKNLSVALHQRSAIVIPMSWQHTTALLRKAVSDNGL